MVTIEVHVRLGCLCQVFHICFLGVSIDALDRIPFRVDYIMTTTVVALVFCARAIFRHCFWLFFNGCMGVSLKFSFVVWASIFSCTTVG